jgi:NAD(P)-dependent dehydrogenase (short-subunit alcohol dehydrogenase family)
VDTRDLTGRTVLVTGAGSGIGRATALLASQRGADIVICDVDEAGLAETEAQASRNGHQVTSRRVDVADRDQMRAFADDVGAVDLLINNAGVGIAGEFVDTPLEEWDWIVSINLLGVVHGCHFFVPKMIERGAGGHVVNVSSMAGYVPSPGLPAYSTTKFAVLGLSEALREELRQDRIGVTAICPGVINTPITRSTRAFGLADDPALRERTVAAYARRNYGPEKVAVNILKAVQRERIVAPVSPEAWFGYALKRTSPRAAGWLVRKIGEASR